MNGNTIRLTYIFICRKERGDLTSFSLKKNKSSSFCAARFWSLSQLGNNSISVSDIQFSKNTSLILTSYLLFSLPGSLMIMNCFYKIQKSSTAEERGRSVYVLTFRQMHCIWQFLYQVHKNQHFSLTVLLWLICFNFVITPGIQQWKRQETMPNTSQATCKVPVFCPMQLCRWVMRNISLPKYFPFFLLFCFSGLFELWK